ncbi:MAG: hypothetical protein ACFFCS_20155 [Candidatus Hodarchaeota archaeon]
MADKSFLKTVIIHVTLALLVYTLIFVISASLVTITLSQYVGIIGLYFYIPSSIFTWDWVTKHSKELENEARELDKVENYFGLNNY